MTKREFDRLIRRIQKIEGVSYGQALELNQEHEALKNEPEPECGIGPRGLWIRIPKTFEQLRHESNITLVKERLSVSQGLFIGPTKLVYCGVGQQRGGAGPDGNDLCDGLMTAMHTWQVTEHLYPGHYTTPATMGSRMHTCEGCGLWFTGRNQAKTCSSRCRKRLERLLKTKGLQNVTVST